MSQFQFIQSSSQDGSFVKENNLSVAMITRPEILQGMILGYGRMMAGMVGANPYAATTHFITEKNGGKFKIVGSDDYKWAVLGKAGKSIPVIRLVAPASAALPGVGKTEFTLAFPEKYFHRNWTVRFSNGQMARVHKDPIQVGNEWHYIFIMSGNDMSEYLLSAAYEPGQLVGWSDSNEGEGSQEGASNIHFPMMFENCLTTRRMAHRVTGSAKNTYVTIKGEKDEDMVWMTYRQWLYYRDWMEMTERGIWLNQYNRLPDGTFMDKDFKTEAPIKVGAGLEQQLSSVNRDVVSSLDPERFWHMLNKISDASDGDQGANITLYTGHGGVFEFDQAMKKSAARLNLVDTTTIEKLDGNKRAFGSQYTTYRGPFGGTITIVNHQMFNDTRIFTGRKGPHGYTDQSYKMFFINHGMTGTEPNVEFVARGTNGSTRQLIHWTTEGGTTFGTQGVSSLTDKAYDRLVRSHDRDSAEMYTLSETGVQVNNPLATGVITINPKTY